MGCLSCGHDVELLSAGFCTVNAGTALLFYSLSLDAKVQDTASMHTGCPVLSGTKWSATKW